MWQVGLRGFDTSKPDKAGNHCGIYCAKALDPALYTASSKLTTVDEEFSSVAMPKTAMNRNASGPIL